MAVFQDQKQREKNRGPDENSRIQSGNGGAPGPKTKDKKREVQFKIKHVQSGYGGDPGPKTKDKKREVQFKSNASRVEMAMLHDKKKKQKENN